jgi:uncharacterized DUF497 family protein
MKYEWDENKRCENIRKHSIDFVDVFLFNWQSALEIDDDRVDYREHRLKTYGFIEGRLVVLVYTKRNDRIRIISLRKADKREELAYYDNCYLYHE